MTKERVMVAMEKFKKQIPSYQDEAIKKLLEEADDNCMDALMSLPLKGKIKTLMFSIFLGGIAVDRFYVGDTGLGISKLIIRLIALFTSAIPVVGLIASLATNIWSFADIFLTYRKARVINFERIASFLSMHKQKKSISLSTPVVEDTVAE